MLNDRTVDIDISLTEPVILMHGTNIPWELPLYMTMWETSFRDSSDLQLHAFSLMENHTNDIDKRLLEELTMITDIRGRFGELANIANNSRERMMERYNEEKKAKIARVHQIWQWVVSQFRGTSMDRYVGDQCITLESMGPVYRNASEYLIVKAESLDSIRHACEIVQERLRQDRSDLLRDKGVSVWLTEQFRVLKEGNKVLEEEQKGWGVQRVQASETHQSQYFKSTA